MSRNGLRGRVLALQPPYAPGDARLLWEGWRELLGELATDDEERRILGDLPGWEMLPDVAQVVDRLERRVSDGDDREIVRRARGFRRILPSPMRRPAPDPVEEKAIATAAAAAEALRLVYHRARTDRVLAEGEWWTAPLVPPSVVSLPSARNPAKAAELRDLQEAERIAEDRWRSAARSVQRLERVRSARQQQAVLDAQEREAAKVRKRKRE